MRYFKAFYLPLLMAGLFCLSGCFTVPETGRSSLNLIPENELATMSIQSFEQLKQQEKISSDPTYNAMLRRVGGRIAEAVRDDVPNARWEFVVFENDAVINAFAMPGGKVAIYTGMFKQIIRSDDDLAVVIGHEIAHVTARHGNERASQGMIVQFGALAVNYATRQQSAATRQIVLGAYGAGSNLGYVLPFSRRHESEADEIGLLYAARAGFDPQAAIGFWQRMQEASGGQAPPEFLSTHPSGSTRISHLKKIMPQALAEYEAAQQRAGSP